MNKSLFLELSRGQQVVRDASLRQPSAWIALDDDEEDWPSDSLPHLVRSDPFLGLGTPQVEAELRVQLERMVAELSQGS